MNMKLKNIFRWSQPELKKRLKGLLKNKGYNPISENGFLYAKGELPVLLVAHLDTVHRECVREIVYSKDGREIWSPQGIGGDDRCGVFMILKIIQELRCHVLFCEDEEIGGIGASKFVKSGILPKVNFIIEMDRCGSNDAVFYDCDNPEFTNFITSFGFTEEWGTFSDISIVAPALGIAAVNISAGYYREHTLSEYVNIEVMRKNIERIKNIIRKANKKYEYIESEYLYGRYSKYYGWEWEDELYSGRRSTKQAYKRVTYVTANRIEDIAGYVLTSDGEFFDSDLYIGIDNKVYIEFEDGFYCCWDDARAFNAAGGHLRYHAISPSYELFVAQ